MLKQTALVTGASSGIGAATAARLASHGYDVMLLGRDEPRLKQVQSRLSQNVRSDIFAFDLKDLSLKSNLLQQKLEKLSPLQLIVNNAGIYTTSPVNETSAEVWMHQFQVNLFSAVQLTQLFWSHFVQQKSGSIINVASTLGVKPVPHTSAYSASKAAMINWTLSLAQEGGAHGIRANCICPGIVDTPIHPFHFQPEEQKKSVTQQMASYQLLGQIGEPNDVAEAIVFLGSSQSKWTTGSILHVDGGINIK